MYILYIMYSMQDLYWQHLYSEEVNDSNGAPI